MSAFDELMNEAKGSKESAYNSLMAEAKGEATAPEFDPQAELDRIKGGDAGLSRWAPDGKLYDRALRKIDLVAGQVEPAITALTGMVAGGLGGVAGLGQIPIHAAGLSDTTPAEVVRAYEQGMTYQPRTDTGMQNLEGMARVNEEYIEPVLAPFRRGDETTAAGGDPWLAAINEMGPEIVGAMFGIKGLMPKKPTMTPKLKTDVKTGDLSPQYRGDRLPSNWRDVKTKISPAGQVVKDKLGVSAVKSGWAGKTVKWVNSQPKRVRDSLREMADIADDYFHKMEADSLPSDVIGRSATTRIDFVNGVRQKAGRLLDARANGQLAKKSIELGPIRTNINVAIRKMGGTIGDDGSISFPKNSRFWKTGNQEAIGDLYAKIDGLWGTGRKPTGLELHDLKKWIDNYIDYGKSQVAQANTPPLGKEAQIVLKSVRSQVNKALQKTDPTYGKINDTYGELRGALNTLQKGAGNIELYGEGAVEPVGQVLRRLLSNAQSRDSIKKGINDISRLAEKYSRKTDTPLPYEDYTPQYRFLSEMEKLWGGFKEESLKGNMGQSAQRMAENPSAVQGSREIVGLTAKQIRKAGTSRDKQLQTLKELLYQSGD